LYPTFALTLERDGGKIERREEAKCNQTGTKFNAKSIRTALRVRWKSREKPAVFSDFCINHAI